jgi:hypothetical protein
MANFLVAVGLFLFAFVTHTAVWRAKRPRATGQALILLLVSCILGGGVALGIGSVVSPALRMWLPPTLGDWAQAIVAALAVACAYVLNYPAVEVESPTLVMIELFARAGDAGLSREELYASLSDDLLITPRIDDLLHEGLAIEIDGKCRLTPKGRRLKSVFSCWRRLLGVGIGG